MSRASLVALLGLLVLLAACQMDTGVTVLPNGVTVDAATKAELIGLQDEFDALVAQKRAALARSGNSEELVEPLVVTAARELLVSKYGDAGLQYLIHGELDESQATVIDESHSSRLITWNIGEDSMYIYRLKCGAEWVTMPWGSYSWGITKTTALLKTPYDETQPVYNPETEQYEQVTHTVTEIGWSSGSKRTTIKDSATNPANVKLETGVSYQTVNSNVNWGFFPGYAKNLVTTHEVWDGVFAYTKRTLVFLDYKL